MSELNVYANRSSTALSSISMCWICCRRTGITQTGGMSAAIELALDDTRFALITDADGPLAWEREDHQGWAVGVYEYQDTSDAVAYESTTNSSVEALMGILPPAS